MSTTTLGRLRGLLRRGQIARTRHVRARIPEFILKDIGLTRAELERDSSARSLGW